MGQKGAASFNQSHRVGNGTGTTMSSHRRWPPGLKTAGLAAIVLVLLAIVAFGVIREATTTGQGPIPALARATVAPQRPAWTRTEEAYIQALWPIHGDVERSAVRLSLGRIFYKTDDIGKTDLKAGVEAALAAFRGAKARLRALQPPPSLAGAHGNYLAAVGLFEESALETLKMFEDGEDQHLLAAYPLSQQGSDKIREVGVKFWQDEFPPH